MSARRREQLEIVFLLETEEDEETFQIGESRLGRIVQTGGIYDIDALRPIVDTMRQRGMAMEFTEHGKKFSADRYLKRTEKLGRWRPIEAGGLRFKFVLLPGYSYACVFIEEKEAGSGAPWTDWLTPFLAVEGFVQAWLVDVEYDYWQNVRDTFSYEVEGRSYAHLPMRSNGLPYPADQIEIDTSNNPGRWIIRKGFREAVGSTMWLSPVFWTLVGEDRKEALLSSNEFEVRHLPDGLIQVIAAEHCFCDESTEGIQRKLRSILFGDNTQE